MAKIEIPEFRIRASQTSKIMGEKGLGDTGKNYVKDWLKSYLYGFRKEFSSKYTAKGNACEDAGIDLVASVNGYGLLLKNTERKYNDYAEGEADLVLATSIDDIKNSWDAYTFPLFETEVKNKDYIWQGQTYLWLYDKETFNLHYTLNDAPPDMIEAEYWKQHRTEKIDGDEVNEELYNYIASKMLYSHLPDHLRLKTFVIPRDENMINKIPGRVLECRDLVNQLKNK